MVYHRPGPLTGQRADGDMAQPKTVRLWMHPQELRDCTGEATEEGASLIQWKKLLSKLHCLQELLLSAVKASELLLRGKGQ
ncbi:hypothetical protein IHE44_0004332, partial [Lamprotornis superbus]